MNNLAGIAKQPVFTVGQKFRSQPDSILYTITNVYKDGVIEVEYEGPISKRTKHAYEDPHHWASMIRNGELVEEPSVTGNVSAATSKVNFAVGQRFLNPDSGEVYTVIAVSLDQRHMELEYGTGLAKWNWHTSPPNVARHIREGSLKLVGTEHVLEVKRVEPEGCHCNSMDLFNYGCKCGYLKRRQA